MSKFWIVYRPGRAKGWPQSFPSRQIAEDFIYENGWGDFMHVIESRGKTEEEQGDTGS